MGVIKFDTCSILIMKKKHPCSSNKFRVLRCGTDIRIKCLGCDRELTVEREKLDKMIKTVASE